jgi:protocatechuate 3,4-dioxygenase beta subunit
MRDDDRPVGRVLSRREVLALVGAGVLASRSRVEAAGGAVPACVVRPEQTEGPFYVEERLNRSDIRLDPGTGSAVAGVPLSLSFRVARVSGGRCTPLRGAYVDVWHCDAHGVYSDVRDPRGSTVGQKFLRGFQTTDADGLARFTTIYPGWYEGRAVHIHFKVRTDVAPRGREFTSQIYFDDALTDRVHQKQPYAARGQRRVRNGRDGLFARGGDQLLLTVAEGASGYAGTFDLGVELA